MKTVTRSFMITSDEDKQLRQQRREYEDKHDVSISVSEYIRRTLFPPVSIPAPLSKPTSELESELPKKTSKYSFNMDDV